MNKIIWEFIKRINNLLFVDITLTLFCGIGARRNWKNNWTKNYRNFSQQKYNENSAFLLLLTTAAAVVQPPKTVKQMKSKNFYAKICFTCILNEHEPTNKKKMWKRSEKSGMNTTHISHEPFYPLFLVVFFSLLFIPIISVLLLHCHQLNNNILYLIAATNNNNQKIISFSPIPHPS